MTALRLDKRHFHALDASRLIAAVAVLFWHYLHFMIPPGGSRAAPGFLDLEPLNGVFGAFYAYGHYAVEYFWIVSGFVFAHVYLGDESGRGRFWIARVARLWPLHLVTLVVVAALQAAFWARNGQHFVFGPNDWPHFVLNLGLAHFWGFQRGMSFNGPSWSLSVEIVAYAAFWALLPMLRAQRSAIAVAAGVAAGLLALQFGELKVFACLAYFFGGVTIYFALLCAGLRAAPLALGGAAGLALAARFGSLEGFAFPSGGLWVVSLFSLALAADAADRGERLTLGKRWGDASYGTYLWHFPIQLVMVLALDALPGGRALAQHWGVLALYLALAIGAGFASHRWFEKPAQKAVLAAAARLRARPAYA